MNIEINPEQYVEGVPFGRKKLISNMIVEERKVFLEREQPYTQEDFNKKLESLEEEIPKIKGLYVVIGGELRFNKIF
jgi:hypothetical protein